MGENKYTNIQLGQYKTNIRIQNGKAMVKRDGIGQNKKCSS